MWTLEFDETGGYDCMTAAFLIQQDHHTKITIDLADFGQENCGEIPGEGCLEAERLARQIVAMLNDTTK